MSNGPRTGVTPEEYVEFVTRLGSKYSMGDFNAKVGTTGLGLGGEAGEIANIVASVEAFDSLADALTARLIDELSDIMWYVAFGAQNVVGEPLAGLLDLTERVPRAADPAATLSSMYPYLMAECGEVADTAKKLLYHGRPYDEKVRLKLVAALREVASSVSTIAQTVCGVTLQDVIDWNVNKLSARYKSLQFTTEEFMQKEEAKE